MKRKLMLIRGGLVFASSFPMIAASCDVKKKDDETSNSRNQDSKTDSESNSGKQESKPNSESNSRNQDSKTDSESNSGKQESKPNSESNSRNQDSKTDSESNSGKQESKPNSESNSRNQDSKTDSESNSGNQDSKTDSESNSGKQGSKTDDSRHESTTPSESIPNDIQTENSEISKTLNKVMEYGKEAWELATLLSKKEEKANELIMKYYEIWQIVKKFFQLHEELKTNSEETKKQIEKKFDDPESKKDLLYFLKRYEESRKKIKSAIMELKRL
ncbi:hypothetical protein FCL66_03890 [Mycoplasma bovis]|nr:hypothetical protein [Mycoplasmopsis bovis]